jgi:uncharacterized tellurite resistance protein B-like protein
MLDAAANFEVCKLLFWVALADREVHRAEKARVRRALRRWDLSAGARAEVEAWLRDERLPAQPDLEVLRPHRDEVLALARTMVEADGVVHEAERGLIADLAFRLA